ncbi:MAG TPA: PDZ domain-containing protein, partial [Acidobacteriota bacterium]
KEILPQLKDRGKVSRGFLGLVPQQITPDLKSSLDLPSSEGVIISSVQNGTPADDAGLKRYDIILELNGNKVESEDQFRRIIADTPPGESVKLKVMRENKVLELNAQVSERSERSTADLTEPKTTPDKTGLRVADINSHHREEFDIPDSITGVVVLHIRQGLSADESGLDRGDVIIEVNKKPVGSASEFEKELKNAKSGQVFLLYVYRDETYQFITLTIP